MMDYELPEHQISIFNQHFEKGNRLSEELIIFKNKPQSKVEFWKRRKAKKAIIHYMKFLELIPNHWQTKWLLAKVYQTIAEPSKALQLFKEAMQIEKLNSDIAREASISAMDAGEVELAIKYSLDAIHRQPDNAGLICNHAINLMISGHDNEALEWIERAIEIEPDDPINQNAYLLIKDVKNGIRKRPRFDELN